MGKFTQRIGVLRGQLNSYHAARDKILTDRDLSEEAKAKRCKILKDQSGAAALAASGELWAALKAADKSLSAQVARAQSAEATRWDNARLVVEESEARARLGIAQSVEEIEEEYHKAAEPHKARAMQIAAMENLTRFLHAGGDVAIKANSLLKQVVRDNEQARITSQIETARAEASDLVDDVLAMENLAKDLANEFYGQPSPLGAPDAFRLQFINTVEKIERKTLPDGKIEIRITFTE